MQYLRIGSYLKRKGLLNEAQIKKILTLQERTEGVHTRFGRIAVEEGVITEKTLRQNVFEKFREEIVDGQYSSLNSGR